MHKQPLMQTPAVLKLRWPRFEGDSVANDTSQVLVIEPANRRLVRLNADGDAIVPCTRLSFGFVRVAGSELVSWLQCAHGHSLTCATSHSRSESSEYHPVSAMYLAT